MKKTIEEILETEYDLELDEYRKNAMTTSYYKYGKVSDNYPDNIDALQSMQKRIKKYMQTGNKEFLADAMNFIMIEFMYPKNKEAYFKPTDSEESPGVVGISVNEAKRLKNN